MFWVFCLFACLLFLIKVRIAAEMGGDGRAGDPEGKDVASEPRGSRMRGRNGRGCFPEEG